MDTEDESGSDLLLHNGPTLWVDVGFDPTLNYAEGGPIPTASTSQIPALVDTGATLSCVDDGLARSLNLPFVDRQRVSGVAGLHEVDVYLAHVAAPSLGWYQWGLFYGVNLAEGTQPHRVLIGRSFLQNMMLIYDGRTGRVQIAW